MAIEIIRNATGIAVAWSLLAACSAITLRDSRLDALRYVREPVPDLLAAYDVTLLELLATSGPHADRQFVRQLRSLAAPSVSIEARYVDRLVGRRSRAAVYFGGPGQGYLQYVACPAYRCDTDALAALYAPTSMRMVARVVAACSEELFGQPDEVETALLRRQDGREWSAAGGCGRKQTRAGRAGNRNLSESAGRRPVRWQADARRSADVLRAPACAPDGAADAPTPHDGSLPGLVRGAFQPVRMANHPRHRFAPADASRRATAFWARRTCNASGPVVRQYAACYRPSGTDLSWPSACATISASTSRRHTMTTTARSLSTSALPPAICLECLVLATWLVSLWAPPFTTLNGFDVMYSAAYSSITLPFNASGRCSRT